jgi:hypothetical protein
MTLPERLLKLGAGLCLVVVPACVHTGREAAFDQPAVTNPWWAPPFGPAEPAAAVTSTVGTGERRGQQAKLDPAGDGNPVITGMVTPKSDPPVAQVSAVQVGPAGPEPSPPALPEKELLARPPSMIELKARQQQEKEQAPEPVKGEARSAPVVTTPTPAAEDPPLAMAVRCLLDKKPAEAVKWLERCDTRKTSQDLLLTLLSLAARIAEGDLNQMKPQEASAAVAQLERVTGTLRPLAEFAIEKMCFCYHIAGFGVYYAWPEDHVFKPGEQVQVYVEFRNFAPRQRKQLYGIELKSSLEIREPDGSLNRYIDPGDGHKPYLSLSPRQNFFVNYQFVVPADLPPNLYTLSIRVVDRPTGRTASKSMEFRVQNSLARGDEGMTR